MHARQSAGQSGQAAGQNEGATTSSSNQPKTKLMTPNDLLARIPIAGLENFFHAREKVEKRIWAFLLIFSAAVTLYYFISCIALFLKFEVAVEVKHEITTDQGIPTVQVCMNPGINRTYLQEKFQKVLPLLEEDHRFKILYNRPQKIYGIANMKQVMDLVIYYITCTPGAEFLAGYETLIPKLDEIIYTMITLLKSIGEWNDIKTLYEEGRHKCEDVLQRCTFQGDEFSCCPKDQKTTIGTGLATCYKINAAPVESLSTNIALRDFSKRLTIETAVDQRNLMNPDDDIFVLTIYIGNETKTVYDLPAKFPTKTLAFISVKTRNREKLKNCTDHFQFKKEKHAAAHPLLQEYFKNMEDPKNYGIGNCIETNMLEELYIRCGCVANYDTIAPNDTEVCTPAHIYICFSKVYEPIEEKRAPAGNEVKQKSSKEVQQPHKDFQKEMMRVLYERAKECMALCSMSYDDVQTTFVDLEKDDSHENSSMLIFNKLVVDFQLEQRQESDVYKIDQLTLFGSIGVAFGFCLGLSGVTFVQGVFWTVAACRLRRKNGRIIAHSN